MRLDRCLVVAIAAGGACNYAHVGSGEMAIVKTPDGVEKQPLTPGDWRICMWFCHAANYSVRSQEKEEQLQVQSVDGESISLDVSIRYHPIPEEIVALDAELGPDYYSVLIGPTVRSQVRRVVGRFRPDEIYSSAREQIEREIRQGVEVAIRGRHVALEAVLVRNVGLPPEIQAKITEKLAAEQDALQQQYVMAKKEAEEKQKLMEARSESERQGIEDKQAKDTALSQAQSQAETVRIAAKAAADAKRIDAQATADYNKLVAQYLSASILRMQEIDAERALAESGSATYVFGGGNGMQPLLDLRGARAAAAGK